MPKSATVFICHRWSEGEHQFAMELSSRLLNYPDVRVIIDEGALKGGTNIDKWMRRSVERSDVFVFIVSPGSLESENCKLELAVALESQKPIIPILLRDAVLPPELKELKNVDLRNAKTLPFAYIEEIVEAIRHHAQRIEAAQRLRKASEGVGSRSLTALSLPRNVEIGMWQSKIERPQTPWQVRNGVLYVSLENLETIPREVLVEVRVEGKHVRFGPSPNLEMTETANERVLLPGGTMTPVEIGFPFSISKDYVSRSASFAVSSASATLTLSVMLDEDFEFKLFT